ncbi:MAG: lactate utilization protein [Dehalococcoidia bacterium]|nr:MAG: lactate utilization protein [Dehalococcoidia bacterium]
MTQETDTTQEKSWLSKARAQTAIKNLNKKHINALYASNRNKALSLILDMVPDGATVVRGDSITLEQMEVISTLKKRGKNRITDPFERDSSGQLLYAYTSEKALNMYREAFCADVFLTGTNAITLDGKLVNTDGTGNRVAPIIFGPKKVIIAAGVNKIVNNVDEARKRISDICAPLDVKRYILKYGEKEYETLPCAKTGLCSDCRNELRFCCYTVIIEAAAITEHNRINVVLIGEELGY